VQNPVLTQPGVERADAPSVAPAAVPAAPGVEVVPLEEVLRQIRADSRRDPRQYLDDTAVPHGGD
jgi:hypothetical protein